MPSDQPQKIIFSDGEANAWFKRNRHSLGNKHSDPVIKVLTARSLTPKNVLEIGCANGWRLKELKEVWPNSNFFGLDPSQNAIESGLTDANSPQLRVGTADHLPFHDKQFDLVIFGFCLYLVDRSDLFRVVAEAVRVLQNKGLLAIFFFYSNLAYSRPYSHTPGIKSYKMDYSKLWLTNPSYKVDRHAFFDHSSIENNELKDKEIANPEDVVAVHLLEKNYEAGWPSRK